MIRHMARTLAVFSLMFAAVACGDDSSGPETPANIAGTYPLRSVNGDPVPSTLVLIGTYRLEIISGNLILHSGNTFSSATTFRETENGTATDTPVNCTGTYTRNGDSVTLVEASSSENCGGTFTGTINGTTLTVAYDAELQAVYRK